MIDYQLLQALSAVITEKGFEKASKKLFITQSAVSRRIRQLESILGEPVLVRSQPPKLTLTGQRLLNHLQQVMQLEVALGMTSIAEDSHYDKPLTVRLAVNADSLATWLPEALAVPESSVVGKLKFELVVEDQSITLNRMKAGEVMICISSNPEPVNGGSVDRLGALPYKAVASPDFVQKYGVDADLSQLPCLVFDENDTLQHDFLEDFKYGEPKYIHSCPSSEGFKQMIVAGLGYGLLPELQIGNSLNNGELVDLKPNYVIETPLFWHYWHTESPQLKALREHALRIAKQKLKH
ncbi:LysR family transcriptional regulator ArgP [Paraglaciecola marina]|uniref:LysR family transcriptional regulator ArgP n=1 Tax=Paraglaciecola marina TaxID=2500157 RepID=UPI00105CB6DC|nr:LysR family transcriptional regulator ArgP [Paraglaciecola marina]